MSTHDPLHAHPLGAYGLFAATAGREFVAGGFSPEQALSNARRVLEAGSANSLLLPVVEVQSFGRGVLIHPERLPRLLHRLPEIVACAEIVRQRFVRTWVHHLAETTLREREAEQVAANLSRILSVDDPLAWLTWRHGPTFQPRCPLTDPWFEEEKVRPDCCGVETPISETDLLAGCYRICSHCAAVERQEAERG